MWELPVVGKSGRRWVVDERQDAALARRGRPFIGWEENNEALQVWVQRVLGGDPSDIFEEDRRHLRQAYDIAQTPGIRACPYIRQVLDIAEPFDLYLIQELADDTLDERVRGGALPEVETNLLERNLTEALNAIHQAGLVHSDVQTSNVFRIDGVWKLGDLGAATSVGAEIRALPVDRRFVDLGIAEQGLAVPELDWWGLAEVLREARSDGALPDTR